MSAVVERAASALPLLNFAQPERVFSWRDGRPLSVARFLSDVHAVAAKLPPAAYAVNLCEDRYPFLVGFCAVVSRGQTNLLPPSRAPAAIDEVLAGHPGSYALGDAQRAGLSMHYLQLRLDDGDARADIAVPEIDGEQVVAIGFTSGSTGHPKANPKTWAALRASSAHNTRTLTEVLGLAPNDLAHIVATVPPQHMYGLELSILLPLLGPFAVHGGRPFFPADVAAALAEVPAPRMLVTTPIHLQALLRDPFELPPLAAITSATAPLCPELAAEAEARYGAPVVELFGSTETCVIAQRRTTRETAWRLYPDIVLRPQPDGTLVDAPYFGEPVVLQDVVELLPDHAFHLRGRNADLVEIAGKRASLWDLTHRLLALPGVTDAVVLQLEEEDGAGVRRIAALVVAPGRCEAALLDGLRLSVDPVFLPRPLRCVDALPRNETGKLARAEVIAALTRAQELASQKA
ncbi:MAG TPA: AMP-binding protein [Rhodanobacteraceae bacterium]|nr:AMP-binding protein [Rhodanobacteraceae bacterium]